MDVEVTESQHLQEPLLNNEDHLSLYSNANFLSILTFSWMSPLLALGRQKRLDLEDIPQLASGDRANSVFSIFREKLQFHRSLGALELAKSLIASAWRELLLSVIFSMIFTLSSFVGPYLIDAFVQYLHSHQDHSTDGYILVSIFLFAKLAECLAQRHWFFRVQRFGMKAHAALVAKIYEKGLTLSNSSTQDSGCGEIVNLMSVDAERIGQFSGI